MFRLKIHRIAQSIRILEAEQFIFANLWVRTRWFSSQEIYSNISRINCLDWCQAFCIFDTSGFVFCFSTVSFFYHYFTFVNLEHTPSNLCNIRRAQLLFAINGKMGKLFQRNCCSYLPNGYSVLFSSSDRGIAIFRFLHIDLNIHQRKLA